MKLLMVRLHVESLYQKEIGSEVHLKNRATLKIRPSPFMQCLIVSNCLAAINVPKTFHSKWRWLEQSFKIAAHSPARSPLLLRIFARFFSATKSQLSPCFRIPVFSYPPHLHGALELICPMTTLRSSWSANFRPIIYLINASYTLIRVKYKTGVLFARKWIEPCLVGRARLFLVCLPNDTC